MTRQMIILLLISTIFFACNNSQKENNTKNPEANYSVASLPNDTLFNRQIIYSSSDNGKTWNPSITGLPNDTKASFFEKKGNEIVFGTENKGLFITENNRKEWKDIGEKLPSKKINALHISGEGIYAGLYNEGIYVTNNDGDLWQSLNEGLPNLKVQGILKIRNEILIGTDVGIYKTKDNLIDWKSKYGGLQILSLQEVNGKIIAGTSNGVLLSNDNGETWKNIHNEGAIHYTSVFGKKIFALYMSGDVFMSEDYGSSWVEFEYSPRKAAYIYELVGVNEYLIMNNSYGVFQSIDNGQNWKHIFNEERFVFFDFIVFDNIIYGGTRPSNEYRNRN